MLNFDDNIPTIEESGSVNLADGCRGQGHVIEFGEKIVGMFAELLKYGVTNGFRRVGRDIGLELFEFVSNVGANQIGPGR